MANGAFPDATTSSGYTPLHLAAREGHRDVATTLLDQGASLGIITKVGQILLKHRYTQTLIGRLNTYRSKKIKKLGLRNISYS